jgi:hypothetical protein
LFSKENLQNHAESNDNESNVHGKEYNVTSSTRNREELQRLRKQQKSPLRRDLVKKTQQAINDATSSVNQSLNAVRRAKSETYQERSQVTAKLRTQWRDEKEDAQQFYAQAEKSRHELLSLQRQLSYKFAKAKAKREIDNRNMQLASIEQETNFKSEVYRTHQQILKEEADRKRRQSIAARRKLRQNNRQGEEKLRMMRIEEEQALLEERHESSVALRETTKANADKRRKSYAFRNGDARRIRELHAQMEAERLQKEHESYELKWAGEKDAEAYKKSLAEQRRDSFAFRNEESHAQRVEASRRQVQEHIAQHNSYELKWAGERDADAYKRQLEEERRKSFKFRNEEGFRQRDETAIRLQEAKAKEHQSYELKWAGEKDAEAYQRELAEERRKSFAKRNHEGLNQRLEEEQRQQEARNEEHQGYELKWAGEKDAEAYKRKMEQKRRESFANRGKEGRRQREHESNQRNDELMQSHQSYELKRAGELDVDAYKKTLVEERRDSFAFRNKEGRRQREDEAIRNAREQQMEHESYELKWAGEKDAEAYKKKLEQERRGSFKFRNEERARHAKVMEELKSIALEKETESLMLKWAGEEDAKAYLAQLEEERRQSFKLRNMEGRRHRELDEEAHNQAVQDAHDEEKLQAACHADVEEYKKQSAARDRASFVYRGKETMLQRLEEENRKTEQQKLDQMNFALETAARGDVEEYLQDCKARRRMSLALRAKEKRRHLEFSLREAEKKRQQQSRDTRDRAMDRKYMEKARQEERARIALDAIRHAHCTFVVNPFAGLLDR